MATINLVDLKKNYGNVPAVKGVNLSVADGELIVLVGPSGCGKSTLLRMVAGLETVSEGRIEIGGRDVVKAEPAERDIAMVFQNYALYPHMSVRGNLEYGLKNRGTPRDEIDRRVAEAADILEIGPLLDRKPRQLSGGQRQRVAMGRAIVREPAAFLFDEPLSNLDAKLRVQMRVEIRKLQRRLKTTSLYVTHDQLEAMTLADRLVVMNGGLVEQIGTPTEVYDRPATLFVAGFIGSPPMNLLPGRAEGRRFTLGTTTLDLPEAAPRDGELLLGVRPEHLQPEAQAWALQVEMQEMLGAERLLYARLGGVPLVLRVEATQVPPALGQAVHVGAAARHLHWFDPQTLKRITSP